MVGQLFLILTRCPLRAPSLLPYRLFLGRHNTHTHLLTQSMDTTEVPLSEPTSSTVVTYRNIREGLLIGTDRIQRQPHHQSPANVGDNSQSWKSMWHSL